MNTDAPWPSLDEAEQRVLKIQTKLHRWAIDDPHRRFDDLHNLVCDPAFLVVAWSRIRGNRGARTAGVDGVKPRNVVFGETFLVGLRADLKARRFVPLPVREKLIPKRSGKLRGLGIPTARDRTVQASLKLVLEPIFEADFKPCSYGFRPRHRAHDAVAEIVHLTTRPRNYEWVLEGDIKACFDEIDHTALMDRVRRRIGDKRVLGLVKAFLKAGVLSEDGVERDTIAGTPQGGIVSPLLANIALSVLDEHFAEAWQAWGSESRRWRRRQRDLPTYRLVRYADDFVVMVAGTRADTEALRAEVAAVIRPMGLRLSEEKTVITHIENGFDFLGWRIQRQRKQGAVKHYTYTFPSKDALARVKAKVRTLTRGGTNVPLKVLLYRLNPGLRGWTNYFRPGSSSMTFGYLAHFSWWRVVLWLRRKHPRANWKGFAAATTSGAASRTVTSSCSIRSWRGQRAIAIGEPGFRRRGREPTRRLSHDASTRTRGEPDAWERARPVRRCGPGRRNVPKGRHRVPARSLLRPARRRDPMPRPGPEGGVSRIGHSHGASSAIGMAPTTWRGRRRD